MQPEPPPEVAADVTMASMPAERSDTPSIANVIYPPEDIRSLIDKTADFVNTNGPEFEQRLLREGGSGTKFLFLTPNHPYRAFYDLKLRELATGEPITDLIRPEVPEAVLEARKREQERKERKLATSKSVDGLMIKDVSAESQGDKDSVVVETSMPPPPDVFAVIHPYAAPIDLEIIEVTSQFVARNGQQFLAGLVQREKANPQFEFLRPTHSLFNYFSNLTTSYAQCIMPESQHLNELSILAGETSSEGRLSRDSSSEVDEEDTLQYIYKKCYRRYKYEADYESRLKAREISEAEDRMAMSTIDWNDFTVVETILFTNEPGVALPRPKDFATLMGTAPLTGMLSAAPAPKPLETPVPLLDAPSVPVGHSTISSSAIAPEPQAKPAAEAAAEVNVIGPIVHIGEKETDKIVVRTDYVRKRKTTQDSSLAEYQKCPITGKLIPANEMSDHLRILLMDPQWKQQKDKLLERMEKDSAFSVDADVESNLAQFVTNRPDLFGTVEDELNVQGMPDTSAPKTAKLAFGSIPSIPTIPTKYTIPTYPPPPTSFIIPPAIGIPPPTGLVIPPTILLPPAPPDDQACGPPAVKRPKLEGSSTETVS